MICIEKVNVYGFEAAIRGMRNPKNSWDKSDSAFYSLNGIDMPKIGDNDLKLMKTLSNAGNDHGKFLRMINVTCDITAPLYWWKEFDAYKIGTVADSCSTMHKIHAKKFELNDFSHEHLDKWSTELMNSVINSLNIYRDNFNESGNKNEWWQMIQLLPSSYNQKRTIQLNYAVLKNMYHARKDHKLDEWHNFCAWAESLPYFKAICIGEQ